MRCFHDELSTWLADKCGVNEALRDHVVDHIRLEHPSIARLHSLHKVFCVNTTALHEMGIPSSLETVILAELLKLAVLNLENLSFEQLSHCIHNSNFNFIKLRDGVSGADISSVTTPELLREVISLKNYDEDDMPMFVLVAVFKLIGKWRSSRVAAELTEPRDEQFDTMFREVANKGHSFFPISCPGLTVDLLSMDDTAEETSETVPSDKECAPTETKQTADMMPGQCNGGGCDFSSLSVSACCNSGLTSDIGESVVDNTTGLTSITQSERLAANTKSVKRAYHILFVSICVAFLSVCAGVICWFMSCSDF